MVVFQANILRYNEENLKKMPDSAHIHPELVRSQLPDKFSRDSSSNKLQNSDDPRSQNTEAKDLEMPMPPMTLAPLRQHGIR